MTKTQKVILVLALLLFGYIGFRYAWHYGTFAYYEYKCANYGGEYIYKTADGVEGLYQIRPRDSRFLLDRLRKRDIPEDPYGHTDWEAQYPQTLFVDPSGTKYRFFETTKPPDEKRLSLITRVPDDFTITGETYWRYSVPDDPSKKNLKVEQTSNLKSKYGFTWKEVRTFWDRFFGIWGGELIVKHLDTEETLGVRRGFFYFNGITNRFGTCPKKEHSSAYKFISRILRLRS